MNRTLACFCFSALLYAAVLAGMLTLCLDPPKEESRFSARMEERDPFLPMTDDELRRMSGLAADSEYGEAIFVELTDFSDETAPKNDLMASIGAITGTGLTGRVAPPPRYAWFWGH